MRKSSNVFFLLVIFSVAMKKNAGEHGMPKNTYLALGDSYTIGEQVESRDNFPNHVVNLLKEKRIEFGPPEIIAQTGWTTDELQAAIQQAIPRGPYDLVTLLIGVNNQYRGRTVDSYIPEFESLLKQAIRFAGDDPGHVIVLSIPDWGVTPFAKDSDRKRVAKEIDEYNSANESITRKFNVHYINVTESTREAANDTTLLAADGLHPSGKEYERWAKKIVELVVEKL